jgi:HEAT repeat protein
VPALDALVACFKAAPAGDSNLPALRKALAAIGTPAAAPLAELLKDPDPALRGRALEALDALGPNAKGAAPALVALLPEEPKELAEAAGRTLVKLAGEAVPPLIEALKDERPASRAAVARILGQIGAPAGAALPALKPLEKDADPAVQAAVKEALEKIGPEPKRRTPRPPKQ